MESPQSSDVTDDPTPNCGWTALSKASEASEGAGYYLQFCCQCVPPAGAAGDAAITSVEHSSKFEMLVYNLYATTMCIMCLTTKPYVKYSEIRCLTPKTSFH